MARSRLFSSSRLQLGMWLTAACLAWCGAGCSTFRSERADLPEYRPSAHESRDGAPPGRSEPIAARDAHGDRSGSGHPAENARAEGSVTADAAVATAENAFRQALEAERRGDHAAARRAWQLARQSYEAVVRQRPNDAAVLHRLAIVCDKLQDFAAAENHYLRALLYRPDDPNLLSDYGYSLIQQNRLHDAEHFLQRAVRLAPQHVAARNNLGLLYALQGRSEQALAQFRAVGSEAEARAKLQQALAGGSAIPVAAGAATGARAVPPRWPEGPASPGGSASNLPAAQPALPAVAQAGAGTDSTLPPSVRELHAEMEAARRAAIEARRARERAEQEAFERRLAYERSGTGVQPPPWPGNTQTAGPGDFASSASAAPLPFPPPGTGSAVQPNQQGWPPNMPGGRQTGSGAWPSGSGASTAAPSGTMANAAPAAQYGRGLAPTGPATEAGLPTAPPTVFGRLPAATATSGGGAYAPPADWPQGRPAGTAVMNTPAAGVAVQNTAETAAGPTPPSIDSAAVIAARIGLQTGPGTLFGGGTASGPANPPPVASPWSGDGRMPAGAAPGFGSPVGRSRDVRSGDHAAPAAGPQSASVGDGPELPQPIRQMGGQQYAPADEWPYQDGSAGTPGELQRGSGYGATAGPASSPQSPDSMLLTPRGEPYRPMLLPDGPQSANGTASGLSSRGVNGQAAEAAHAGGNVPVSPGNLDAAVPDRPQAVGARGAAMPAGVTVPGQLTPTPPWLMTPASGSVATDVSQQLRRYDEELRLLQQKLAESARPAAPRIPGGDSGGPQ